MENKEIKGNPELCPYCGSDRVSPNTEVEMDDDSLRELSITFFCLDCAESYEPVFVFSGRLIVESE